MPDDPPRDTAESSAQAPHTCGHCGYDLRDIRTNICPECGKTSTPWDPRSDKVVRRLHWLNIALSALPLAWVALSMAAFVAATRTMGERPGMIHHPSGATKPLYVMYLAAPWAWLGAIMLQGWVWFALAQRLAGRVSCARDAAMVFAKAIGWWIVAVGIAIGAAAWDPTGVVSWMAD